MSISGTDDQELLSMSDKRDSEMTDNEVRDLAGRPWGKGQAVDVRYAIASPDLPDDLSVNERLTRLWVDRETWPWLIGEILGQCGPGEWEVVVYDERLAQMEDGSPAPPGTPPEDLFYPTCYRDALEIREPFAAAEATLTEATILDAADPMPDLTVVAKGEPSAEWLRAPDREAGQ